MSGLWKKKEGKRKYRYPNAMRFYSWTEGKPHVRDLTIILVTSLLGKICYLVQETLQEGTKKRERRGRRGRREGGEREERERREGGERKEKKREN